MVGGDGRARPRHFWLAIPLSAPANLSGAEYEQLVVEKAMPPAGLSPGERADVSWIMTGQRDRARDVVLLSGFRDELFRGNPIVTLNHNYTIEPVGKSVWRRKVREGGVRGVKAKAAYPERPAGWTGDRPWPADAAFALGKSGLMTGKSIGFLTLKARPVIGADVARNPEWKGAARVVEEWQLLEYCCCWLPVNPARVVEAVSKALVSEADLKSFGIDLPKPPPPDVRDPNACELASEVIPFTSLAEVVRTIAQATAGLDLDALTRRADADAADRARGRV
jgi:hypothetical protein